VSDEIVGRAGSRAAGEVCRGADHGDFHWRHDANRDHICSGAVLRPDPGIESPCNDIDRGFVENQLLVDVRVG
jgi:hypothetical protein